MLQYAFCHIASRLEQDLKRIYHCHLFVELSVILGTLNSFVIGRYTQKNILFK